MKRALVAFSLLLLAPGCGFAEFDRDAVPRPRPWPVRQPPPFGTKDARPSIVYSIVSGKADSGGSDEEAYDPRRVLEVSGLFKEVLDKADPAVPAIRVNITVWNERHFHWYSAIGIVPVLPLVMTNDVRVVVQLKHADGSGREYGTWQKEDGVVWVFCTALLPLDGLGSTAALGGPFDLTHFHRENACADRALRGILAEIDAAHVLDEKN